MANTYYTSDGEWYTTDQINTKIRKAKLEKVSGMAFPFCEDCGRSDKPPYDCSHTVSVKWAKENRQSELCWLVQNIKMRCRQCHNKHDGNV